MLAEAVVLLGAKVPCLLDLTTTYYSRPKQLNRLFSADLSNWSTETARKTSRGFESQVKMVFPKTLETLYTLVRVWV